MNAPVCTKHPRYAAPEFCPGCRSVEDWVEGQRLEQKIQAADKASSEARVKAAKRRQEIDACYACDTSGYINGKLCRHSDVFSLAAGRGVEKARQALREARERNQQ